MNTAAEVDAFRFHLPHAPRHHLLFHLEIGDPEYEQAARYFALFVDGYGVTRSVELLGRCESRWSGSDYGNSLTRPVFWNFWLNPALVPPTVRYGLFDRLDGDRVVVDAEHARRLAGCRTDPSGDLGEVVGRVQHP